MKKPELFIIGGANGSGKTTFAREIAAEENIEYLGADDIAAKLNPSNFAISVFFIFLDSPELCIQRIAARVARGGHHVPDADVRRRYTRANKNFWQIYRNLADDWFLIYNAGDSFEQIANGDANGVIIFDEERYHKWQTAIK